MKQKKITTVFSVLLVILVFIVSQTSSVSAFSVRELLGLDEPKATEEEKQTKKTSPDAKKGEQSNQQEWAKTSEAAAAKNPQLNLEYVSLLIANMNGQERAKVLTDPALFKQVIEAEAKQRSVLSAALVNKMAKDKNVEFLMRRGAENIVREAYLKRLVASKLPNDFPSQEQVIEYYEKNKSQFLIPERIHVWQIFFSKSETDKENQAVKKKAEKIVKDLKKGKSDFSDIASEQSEHEQSRNFGGYMGLLKTTELLPEIKEVLLKLKKDEISKVVESKSGIHILKRGEKVQAETLELAQVKAQIKKLLINQASTQLRNAIYAQASKEFPQDIPEKKLEEWRLRLKTNTTP